MQVSNSLLSIVFGATTLIASQSLFAIDGVKARFETNEDVYSEISETRPQQTVTKYELIVDIENFEQLTQDEQNEKISIVLNKLNIQYQHIAGDKDNNTTYQLPFSGYEINRFGDDELSNRIGAITLLGVGAKKTIDLKRTDDGTIKLVFEGSLYGQYVIASNSLDVDCPECTTDVIGHGEAYNSPNSMDWAVQSRVKVSLDINDKFIISAYNNTYSGTGGGTFNWAHNKATDSHQKVDIDNTYDYRETGLKLEYKRNKRLSFFMNLSQSETKWKKTISEHDLDGDVTTTTREEITNSDGSTDYITVDHTEYMYEQGHKRSWEEKAENVNVMVGVTFKFWGPK